MRGGSFTDTVVAELAPHLPLLPHCRAALLSGMTLTGDPNAGPDVVETPRAVAARCALAMLHADGRVGHASRVRTARRVHYRVDVPDGRTRYDRGQLLPEEPAAWRVHGARPVSRPDRPPHLEIPTRDAAAAAQLVADLGALEVAAVVRMRRARPVVTVRTAAAVGAALSSMGAQGGRLAFEEGRVVRDVRAGSTAPSTPRPPTCAERSTPPCVSSRRPTGCPPTQAGGMRCRRRCGLRVRCAAPTPTPRWNRSRCTPGSAGPPWPDACDASWRPPDA